MDKGRNKRVVLTAGLLFLMLSGIVFLCFQLKQDIEQDYQEKLGYLLSLDPEREADYISIFQGNTTRDQKAAREAGERLEEKYGYLGTHNKNGQMVVLVLAAIGGICIAGALVYLFMYWRQQKAIQELRIEKFMLTDKVSELEAEQELLKNRMQREETETKSLVTDISHQLKTPLSSLKMCYEIADTNSFTPEEQRSFLIQGQHEVKKLENLTQSLINLSRLETRMIQITPESASLKKTLLAAVNGVYMKAFEKNIAISVNEFEDDNLFLDPRWTQEALLNVLDNGIKYSPSDTSIEIRVTPMVSYHLIEIEDQGVGVPKEEMNQIFKRFYRGKASGIQKTEGSGVGLYLTRRILEEQGGSIRVKRGRKGSVFLIALPKIKSNAKI
ncbi:MAG TPA: HAMP domain-containing histidine kinase [Candidatus Pelethocola excrementipullorum]|nr:HAMP domain-containing histidine kinase [Candidatus Pelethocola excrementipullorum]